MWEPRRLTALWASTACYRDSFTFFTFILVPKFRHITSRSLLSLNMIFYFTNVKCPVPSFFLSFPNLSFIQCSVPLLTSSISYRLPLFVFLDKLLLFSYLLLQRYHSRYFPIILFYNCCSIMNNGVDWRENFVTAILYSPTDQIRLKQERKHQDSIRPRNVKALRWGPEVGTTACCTSSTVALNLLSSSSIFYLYK
jgi:hypothetical protein